MSSGIDYTHPALGAGFGPGHKVIGGFDLVGDAYNGEATSLISCYIYQSQSTYIGSNTPVPDPDPLDQCAGEYA